ncbi:rhomboid family intramembrane serine protease [Haloarchaeobius iranensis]|uniref:Membrane associated serine protease, rhomboid family n=1 Tax=Haloarchaeobius iranensis TaxID=996166 RepID=A0A1G9XKF1_9EURY|nr:rhomboid family intramembrane serine protease [Haloarchaeobius iranensis]SDM97247.1 Membrane associated serine protease, rhomboid family [Haloarchaeobius iranensis]
MSRGSPTLDTLVVFAVVFAFQVLVKGLFGVLGAWRPVYSFLFVLDAPVSQPWTFVTSVYSHAGVGHLLSNAVALVLVGFILERYTTRLRFHLFFVGTGAIAGLSQVLLSGVFAALGVGRPAGVLGASGAVFALYGYVLGGNRLTDGLLRNLDIPEWVEYAAFLVVALVVTVATGAPGVALFAHFTGFLVGLAAGRANLLAVSQSTSYGPRKERY